MIRFATDKEKEQIVSLWQEAFGDSREWVLLYLSENIKNVLIYEENGTVMGMLSLLEVSFKGKKGFYVYGVATGEAYRSGGISTKLLEYAKELAKGGFLVLVPRNQGLFDFYKNRGFFSVFSVETREYTKEELTKICDGTKVYTATSSEYFDIRKKHFDNLIEWSCDKLSSIKIFENGKFYKTKSGDGAFCYYYDGILYIKELCGSLSVAGEICREFDAEVVLVTKKADSSKPSCMTYPEFAEKVFFNISID